MVLAANTIWNMCGICGFLGAPSLADDLTTAVRRMSDAIQHRGPDAGGAFVCAETGIALGHRRLSIVDLSPEGHQPMTSAGGRYVIAFNGEIYNYPAVRAELEHAHAAPRWRGHSDTEVMLAAIEEWGVQGALERFNGMFAFALWDRRDRTLYLSRDRIGEKPLYYGWVGTTFMFGSELKAFYAHPEWSGTLDRGALTLFLRFNYVPAPHSIWQGVSKLPPGTLLTLRWADGAPRRPHTIESYWSARDAALRGSADRFTGSEAEATDALDALLRDAIGIRMHADVPLGAFLSGGVDSSAIVSLMQAQSSRPVRTFTIGFKEAGFDEAVHAASIARHLGTDHTELYIDPQTAMAVIPRLPTMYDEPFADSSQIPTFLVSQLARQHVTVALSGDGADELFAGYRRHTSGASIWRMMDRVPYAMRGLAARGLRRIPSRLWDRMPTRGTTGSRLRHGARAAAGYLGAPDRFSLYHRLSSSWVSPSEVTLGIPEPIAPITDSAMRLGFADFTDEMTFLDLVTYLPGDVLAKVDRASMAVSLEGRMPFLDHRLVEFAWRLPVSMKVRDGRGKWILRQVLYRYVPPAMIDRPKMGFAVPIDAWLRGPLRGWAEELLDARAVRDDGLFDVAPIRAAWDEQIRGQSNNASQLWGVLMFQAWLRATSSGAPPIAHR